jgi:hypothetical protein
MSEVIQTDGSQDHGPFTPFETRCTTDFSIVLVGSVRQGRYLVQINGADVLLTYTLFRALIDLVHARLTTLSGFTSIPSVIGGRNTQQQVVWRLRRSIDASLGKPLGARLVVHAFKGEYFIDIPPCAFKMELSFQDLAPNHLPSGLVSDLKTSIERFVSAE